MTEWKTKKFINHLKKNHMNEKISVEVIYSIVDGQKVYHYDEMLAKFEEQMANLDPAQYSTTSR